MQIHERIYIVGSGVTGIGISHESDCTVYMVDGGGEYALIDTGIGIDANRILQNIDKEGIDIKKISAILLTHGHGDHSGGAVALSQACHAKVYALEETANYVSSGDVDSISIKEAIQAGVFGKDYIYQACPVTPLLDKEHFIIGDITLQIHRTEGHCSGHGCYEMNFKNKKILFSGDAIFNYGMISMQSIWDCDLQKYIETCKKLAYIHPDILLPSHGTFLLEKGYTYIDKAMETIHTLGIPKNLINI